MSETEGSQIKSSGRFESEQRGEENLLLYTGINELLYLTKDILGIAQDILDEVRFQKGGKKKRRSYERD